MTHCAGRQGFRALLSCVVMPETPSCNTNPSFNPDPNPEPKPFPAPYQHPTLALDRCTFMYHSWQYWLLMALTTITGSGGALLPCCLAALLPCPPALML